MKFVIEDGRLTEYEGNTEKTQVVIPDCVTSIGTFVFCRNLTKAVIPEGVTEIQQQPIRHSSTCCITASK